MVDDQPRAAAAGAGTPAPALRTLHEGTVRDVEHFSTLAEGDEHYCATPLLDMEAFEVVSAMDVERSERFRRLGLPRPHWTDHMMIGRPGMPRS